MRTFWHVLKAVRSATIFTFFYLSGAFFGVFLLPFVARGVADRDEAIRRRHRAITAGFRLVLAMLRGARIFDFEPRRVALPPRERPRVIVVNHPTTIDVVAVLAVHREAVVVVKDKIWNDRFLRFLFRWTGHIHGGDGSIEAGIDVVEAIRDRLARGFDVVVFPEGTRSPPHGIAPFMKGAFAIATQTKADVLPIVLTSDPPALHKEAPWHQLPVEVVRYRMRHEPLVPVAGKSTRFLLREVTSIYETALGTTQARTDAATKVA